MDLRRLEHFLTVTECGSFGKAARQLGMTQSGLTKSIQTLEESVGILLFIRHARGVDPTKYGRSLAEHAILIRAQANNALVQIDALKSGHSGSLQIGVSPSWIMDKIIPGVVAELNTIRPDLDLGIFNRVSSKKLYYTLRAGQLDIIIGTEQPDHNDEDVEFIFLNEDIHAVIVRKKHPLLKKRKIVLNDFESYGWVLREEGTLYRQRLESIYAEHKKALPNPAIQTNSIPFTLATVSATDYLSAARQADIKAMEHKDIVMLDPPFRWTRNVGVMRRRNKPLSGAGLDFIDRLKSHVAKAL